MTKQEYINKKVLKKQKPLAENQYFRYVVAVLFCMLIIVLTAIFMLAPHFNYLYGHEWMEKIGRPFFIEGKVTK